MRRIITAFVALSAMAAMAQNTTGYTIRVTALGEAVPYAYVLRGEAFVAMTDETGTARVRASQLHAGDVLSARFVGMESVPQKWNETTPEGATVELKLIPNAIEEVVVTAKNRDRSRQYFRKHVNRLPIHGWYTGFRGEYDVKLHGNKPWEAKGTYTREHVPGNDVGALDASTFTLRPGEGADPALEWQIQRHLLTVKSIAERAVQFDGSESNKGMVLRYRGRGEDGRNVFLVIKPYFDKTSGRGESFQTLIRVNEASGIVHSSETISQSRYGIWTVSATYATYSPTGRSLESFIYPTKVTGRYDERSAEAGDPISVDVELEKIEAYHFIPEVQ